MPPKTTTPQRPPPRITPRTLQATRAKSHIEETEGVLCHWYTRVAMHIPAEQSATMTTTDLSQLLHACTKAMQYLKEYLKTEKVWKYEWREMDILRKAHSDGHRPLNDAKEAAWEVVRALKAVAQLFEDIRESKVEVVGEGGYDGVLVEMVDLEQFVALEGWMGWMPGME